jgi:hypothetical protein
VNILNDKSITGQMLFYTKTKEDRIKSFYTSLDIKAKDAIRESYLKIVDKKKGVPIGTFRPADHDPAGLQFLPLDQIPRSDEVVNNNPAMLVDLSRSFFNKVKFRSVYFQNSSHESVIIFRKYQRTKFLGQPGWKDPIAYIFQDKTLKLLAKDTIVVDPIIDCIVFDKYVIIFHKGNFESIFSYLSVYNKHARSFFNFFEKECPYHIEDLGKIEGECKSLSRLRKVSNIYSLGSFKSIKLDKISEHNTKYKLGINIDRSGQSIKFPNDRLIFLRVYGDDYLKSDLTQSQYMSHNKEKLYSSSVLST